MPGNSNAENGKRRASAGRRPISGNGGKDAFAHLENAVHASASSDCTGLIPSAPESKSEKEAYKELYGYEGDATDKRH